MPSSASTFPSSLKLRDTIKRKKNRLLLSSLEILIRCSKALIKVGWESSLARPCGAPSARNMSLDLSYMIITFQKR